MIRKQNIPATLMIFLNLLKMLMENIVPKKQSPKLLLMNFLAKFLAESNSQ